MSLIIPTLYILIITISLMLIIKKSFCYTLPISIIGVSLLIMVAGYIGDLRISVYSPLVLSLLAIYLLITKKTNSKNLITTNNIITFIVFVLFVLYIGYYHKNGEYRWWDDYSHWGPMVKGMIQSNKLYCDLSINNAHPDYPPLVQCFEYLWCYVAGKYSEPSVLRALSLFTFSLFFPIFELFKDKSKNKQIFCVFVSTLVTLLLNAISYTYLFSYLEWIYLDFTVSVLAAITLFLAFTIDYKKRDQRILLSIYLIALLLLKEITIAFYAMIIFTIMFVNTIKSKKNILKDLLCFVAIPCLFFVSWKIKTSNISGQFSMSHMNLADTFSVIFFNKGTDVQLSIKSSFINALFNKTIISSPFDLNFVTCSIICLILILIISFVIYRNNIKNLILLNVVYILGVLGYTFTMLFLYLTSFSVGEATSLASFERYFGIYVHLSIVLILLFIISISISNKIGNYLIKIVPLLLVISLIGNNYKILFSYNKENGIKMQGIEWEELVKQLDSVNYSDNKRVLVLQRIGDIRITLNLNYMYINSRANTYDMYENDKDYVFKDENELIDLYKDKYDYVYIFTSGQELWNVWKKTNNDYLFNNRLYKVIGDRLELVPWISAID